MPRGDRTTRSGTPGSDRRRRRRGRSRGRTSASETTAPRHHAGELRRARARHGRGGDRAVGNRFRQGQAVARADQGGPQAAARPRHRTGAAEVDRRPDLAVAGDAPARLTITRAGRGRVGAQTKPSLPGSDSRVPAVGHLAGPPPLRDPFTQAAPRRDACARLQSIQDRSRPAVERLARFPLRPHGTGKRVCPQPGAISYSRLGPRTRVSLILERNRSL